MKLAKIIFGVIGLIMLAIAFLLFNSTRSFISEAELTQGTVTELVESRSKSDDGSNSITYAPVVSFVTDAAQQVTYHSSTSSNPPSYQVGETVEMYYLPEQPNKAKINGFFDLWLGTVICGVLGAVFFSVGFGLWWFARKQKNKTASLLSGGLAIETKFETVEINETLRVNGRHPYQIVSHWQNPDTSKLHIFKSNNIWFDPSDYINQEHITVYVAPDNYKKYYLDTSFLPEIA